MMITVLGYGSLLSQRSALETVPSLTGFRRVRVPGYRRIFNKVGVVFFSRHGADPASLEIASCSTQAMPGSEIICSAFEVPEADFPALYEREHRFRWIEAEALDETGSRCRGRICTGSNDMDYRLNKCVTPEEYHRRVGQYYGGSLWRDDILPYRRYLAFCLEAAASQGQAVLDNFMDSSFLADGHTSIREYLSALEPALQWQDGTSDYSYRAR
ncbi:gamma-glutamylcyclotransferase family protein [Marinobacterium rhizophilum]|uniref:gamma-glutamylcyclotransferase family protein n=1 Tax=Marinobacterium rhizophilum TaxID=420402 RepID=UPI0003725D33|nr:gamma-glutamylcyclotransferase family protein [Marinobacterium rhizophilum]